MALHDLLMANPEGDFNLGGVDPGIKSTRFIFEHTYSQGKEAYYNGQVLQSCAMSEITNAYSGQTSYKNELSVNVDESGEQCYTMVKN